MNMELWIIFIVAPCIL